MYFTLRKLIGRSIDGTLTTLFIMIGYCLSIQNQPPTCGRFLFGISKFLYTTCRNDEFLFIIIIYRRQRTSLP